MRVGVDEEGKGATADDDGKRTRAERRERSQGHGAQTRRRECLAQVIGGGFVEERSLVLRRERMDGIVATGNVSKGHCRWKKA